MFLGEHSHSLDAKGRVILPSRFRDDLEAAFVTSEVDGCLALWPPDEFQRRSHQMKAKWDGTPAERNQARVFFAGAQDASPDKQGRVAIPAPLREFAHLEREVAITGAFDHVEIWDSATWAQTKRSGEQGLAGDQTSSDQTSNDPTKP
ncbi:MAG: division/cell wall cluster transcriptional repressor MraZ [Acidimicrobiales bacterium]